MSNARSLNYIRQIKGSFIFKALAVIATFLSLPLMIKYLGNEMFGVWATMLTLISWVMLFDLGIGNGLRNKIAESLAKGDLTGAKEYISTAYIGVGFISVMLLLFIYVVSYVVNWQAIFNTTIVSENTLRSSILYLSFFICFNFWLSLVCQIYHGLQRSSVVVFGQFTSNTLALLFIYVLFYYTESSILYLVVSYGIALVLSNLILSLFLFFTYRHISPSLLKPKINKLKPLMNLGIQFFIIQIAVLVMFMTDKMVITQVFGPAQVASYEVVYKLFSVFTIIHILILTPLWPAYNEAYHKKEFDWIRRNVVRQLYFFVCLSLLVTVVAYFSHSIIKVWVGDSVIIPSYLVPMFLILTVIMMWNNVFGYFIGAIGKLKLGVFITSLSAIFNIPLSLYLARTEFGVSGIVLATCLSILLSSVISPLQYLFYVKQGLYDEK